MAQTMTFLCTILSNEEKSFLLEGTVSSGETSPGVLKSWAWPPGPFSSFLGPQFLHLQNEVTELSRVPPRYKFYELFL